MAQTGDPPPAERLEWRVFLLGRHPLRGLLALAVCAFTTWFAWSLSQSPWITAVAAFILMASLSSFFFPTFYRLDAEAVLVRNPLYWRRRLWSEFRGLRREGPRLKLLTLPGNSRLDNYRGMLLLLPEDAEPVVDFVMRRIEEAHGEVA
jgi:hypothetical protein